MSHLCQNFMKQVTLFRTIVYSSSQCFCNLEFLRVIDDPLFENLGVIDKFRGSELFLCIITLILCMRQYLKAFEECPLISIIR